VNHGKSEYWRRVDFAYKKFKDISYDYFFQLPDDIMLTDGFFDSAIEKLVLLSHMN
jgi:hypothetical protein